MPFKGREKNGSRTLVIHSLSVRRKIYMIVPGGFRGIMESAIFKKGGGGEPSKLITHSFLWVRHTAWHGYQRASGRISEIVVSPRSGGEYKGCRVKAN